MELTREIQEFFRLVLHERAEQDKQWGGEAHHDAHCQEDWRQYIAYQLKKKQPFYRCMVKVAALALAAYLSNRRKENR